MFQWKDSVKRVETLSFGLNTKHLRQSVQVRKSHCTSQARQTTRRRVWKLKILVWVGHLNTWLGNMKWCFEQNPNHWTESMKWNDILTIINMCIFRYLYLHTSLSYHVCGETTLPLDDIYRRCFFDINSHIVHVSKLSTHTHNGWINSLWMAGLQHGWHV